MGTICSTPAVGLAPFEKAEGTEIVVSYASSTILDCFVCILLDGRGDVAFVRVYNCNVTLGATLFALITVLGTPYQISRSLHAQASAMGNEFT